MKLRMCISFSVSGAVQVTLMAFRLTWRPVIITGGFNFTAAGKQPEEISLNKLGSSLALFFPIRGLNTRSLAHKAVAPLSLEVRMCPIILVLKNHVHFSKFCQIGKQDNRNFQNFPSTCCRCLQTKHAHYKGQALLLLNLIGETGTCKGKICPI